MTGFNTENLVCKVLYNSLVWAYSGTGYKMYGGNRGIIVGVAGNRDTAKLPLLVLNRPL